MLPILWHYLQQKFSSPKDAQDLRALQQKKWPKLQAFLKTSIPFYQNLNLNDLTSLPILEKRDYLTHFHSLNSLGLTHAEARALAEQSETEATMPAPHGVHAGLSTGTSGERGVFVTQRGERARWAGTILAKCLPRPLWSKQKIAFFLRADNQLYKTIGGSKRIQLRFFDLRRPWQDTFRELKEFAPDMLLAPPHVLMQMVRAGLKLRSPHVYSVADVLDDSDRAVIEHHFSVRLGQVYQATEGFLGATCAQGTLHLNEDLLLFEKEVLSGQHFVPLITDYHRRSQSMVRFRLNDVLVAQTTPCPCGSPLLSLERIEGRRDEILFLHDRPVFRSQIMAQLAGLLPAAGRLSNRASGCD